MRNPQEDESCKGVEMVNQDSDYRLHQMQVNGKEDPGAKTGKPSPRKDCTGTVFPLLYDGYLLWFQRTTFLKVQDGCQDLRIGFSMFTIWSNK